MSWWIVNLTFGFELFVMWMVIVNIDSIQQLISNIHLWLINFPDELNETADNIHLILEETEQPLPEMIRHFRFIVVTILVTIFANMADPKITPFPLMTGLYFTFESLLHLYKINTLGNNLNFTMDLANEELMEYEENEIKTNPQSLPEEK